ATLVRVSVSGLGVPPQRSHSRNVRWAGSDTGRSDAHRIALELLVRAAHFYFSHQRRHGRDAVHYLLHSGNGDGPPGRAPARAAISRATSGATRHGNVLIN